MCIICLKKKINMLLAAKVDLATFFKKYSHPFSINSLRENPLNKPDSSINQLYGDKRKS